MLLGSFQGLPVNEDGKIYTLPELKRPFLKEVGFAPIWAFPITDLKSAVVHALFTAPNLPEVLYIFDTEDYVRVDKVKHYQYISGNENVKISDWLGTDVDDMHSEMLIDPIVAEGSIDIMLSVEMLQNFLTGDDLAIICPCFDDIPNYVQKGIRDEILSKPIFQFDYDKVDLEEFRINLGNKEVYKEYTRLQTMFKLFCLTIYPFAVDICLNDGASTLKILSGHHNYNKLMEIQNEFSSWSRTDCKKEEYDRLFYKAMDYVIDNDDVLECIVKHRIPYPNDKCPCGSGLKFKKCHGRFV